MILILKFSHNGLLSSAQSYLRRSKFIFGFIWIDHGPDDEDDDDGHGEAADDRVEAIETTSDPQALVFWSSIADDGGLLIVFFLNFGKICWSFHDFII